MATALTHRFDDALQLAIDLHREQQRKGSGVPYFAHLAGVASLALEYGADEDEAIAALLHDAVEDQGGQPTADRIEMRFGARVVAIVLGCSDSVGSGDADADGDVKLPWRQRKEAYLQHLARASASVALVSGCDKLYNARAIVRDLERHGGGVWSRFSAGRDGVCWYYKSLVVGLTAAGSPVVRELAAVVDDMLRFA